ncbi:MAG TPA: hypothetical protein EYP88_05005 [Anaerolineales bacterium]|nr:hypothetical protein [Anaerolineales bacterium]
MTKRKSIIILATVLLAVGILGGTVLSKRWNQPLGESLALPTATLAPPTATETAPTPIAENTGSGQAASPTPLQPETPLPTSTATPIPTATPEPLCGGPPVMTILALGVDTNSYLYGLADAIKLVRVDFVTPKVTVISMPRDLWVQIPGLEASGVTEGKLNQAYFYGSPGMGYYDGPGAGPGLMARTLQNNFGFAVDHYGTVNMYTFVRMVNAVGGIDLYLERDVDGRPVDEKTEDMGYFYAGYNHMTGEAALRFSRIRKTDNNFARMDRQKMVLCALKDKLLRPEVLPDIPDLIASFQGSIVTDLSPAQISQLACLLPKLDDENIIFGKIPEDELTGTSRWDARNGHNTFVWDVDPQVISDYLARFQAGEWPVYSGEGAGCPPPVEPRW